jgi:hypothetical protein
MKLSKNARYLLMFLASPGRELYAARDDASGRFVFVPSKDFNWDGRIATQRVAHPEALDELAKLGYLRQNEYDIKPGGSFDCARHSGRNLVYEVTNEGRKRCDAIHEELVATPTELAASGKSGGSGRRKR